MTEKELLVDCLKRLNETKLGYMVTGSMASNYWGIPRSTHDLDFVLQLPIQAVSRIVSEFSNDFYIDEQAVNAAFRAPHQFNAIHNHSSLKVDFWLTSDRPFDREMFCRRKKATIFKTSAWVASAEDIILHKLYWDKISPSERQLGDVAGVYAVQRDNLDREYLRHWASELGVAEKLSLLFTDKLKPKMT